MIRLTEQIPVYLDKVTHVKFVCTKCKNPQDVDWQPRECFSIAPECPFCHGQWTSSAVGTEEKGSAKLATCVYADLLTAIKNLPADPDSLPFRILLMFEKAEEVTRV
jgi:hypothetical protein